MARRSRGTRFAALAVTATLASGTALGSGCGESDPPDPVLERGPAPPAGGLIATDATLRGGADFTTLATATNRSQGTGQALIVGLAVIERGVPELRILIEGDPVPSEGTQFTGGGGRVAAIYCSCDLPVGDSDITLEGRSRAGGVIGARSLMTFTPAAPEQISGTDLVDAVGFNNAETTITPSGSVMATTQLRSATDEVLLLSAYSIPRGEQLLPAGDTGPRRC